MGRPLDYWQCTPLNCGSSSIWQAVYNYNLAGDVTSWTHPAGFTITQTINAARDKTSVRAWGVRAIRIAKLDRAVQEDPSNDIPADNPAS